ncbi:hypothetical protein JCM17039_20510 [Blautia glucerasea]
MGVFVTVVAVVLAAGVVLVLGFCGVCFLFLHTFYFLEILIERSNSA